MMRVRNVAFLMMALSILVVLTGCGLVEMIVGVKTEKFDIVEKVEVTDPETGEKTIIERVIGQEERKVPREGPSPLEIILGMVVPGLAGLAGTARWAYIEASKRKVDKSLKAVVAGVTHAVDAAKGEKLEKAKLYGAITGASELYGNRKFFAEAVAKIKADIRNVKKIE